ncbi:leucine-rich repeat-containing protein 56-like isoform X2 [Amphibalanus amphitrite]|uniref:leucine-rich repeat-containing protein 56-like isoform X2 n=1 Tax=Amphibalanus amphitrite TaxID=1232801 RepID=UPI001C9224A2|nr:leucine-rich repeat-containing protein 56-like isoform X2 [Amphibalanus amphitrite]
MKPPQPRPGDDEPAPLPHVRVTATTDSAELRSQLAVRDLTAVRAVSVSAEPEAAAALSWTLQQLRVLWLVGCALETLDGVCALPRLQELYVARNRLTDVSICSCLDQLQVLDVEDNQVSDLTSCMFLRACSELRSLNLLGNPVCAESEQLQQLGEWLPQLQTLNGQLTAAGERLLRRLQRSPQQQLPPVVDTGLRRGSASPPAPAVPSLGARRRQSTDTQSTSSSLSRPSTGSGASLLSSSLSRQSSPSLPSSGGPSLSSGGGPSLPANSGPSLSSNSGPSLPSSGGPSLSSGGGPSLPSNSGPSLPSSSSLSRPSPSRGSSLPSPSPASSPRRQPASPPCPSPRLPAIGGGGARRPAVGRPTDTGAAGERLEGRLGEVKINTWMAEVGGGKTPPDRQLASECK